MPADCVVSTDCSECVAWTVSVVCAGHAVCVGCRGWGRWAVWVWGCRDW